MPPADKLTPSVLAALGLAACSGATPCLKIADTTVSSCLTSPGWSETGTDTGTETGDTGTTIGPCLSPTYDTGETDTSSDTGADTGTSAGLSSSAIFRRLEIERVLPSDVIERLKRRGE